MMRLLRERETLRSKSRLTRSSRMRCAAGVAELVDAGDSKSPDRKVVRVRFPPPAPHRPACRTPKGQGMLSRVPSLWSNRGVAARLSRRSRLGMAALCLVFATALLPAAATAQMREFTGEVKSASGKKLVVNNRMGDAVAFTRIEETRVGGLKSSWSAIARGDRVTVKWKENRKAYSVRVLPPRKPRKPGKPVRPPRP